MKVLAIQNYPVEGPGNLPVKAEIKFSNEIDGNEDFDFLIILGGPMGVYEEEKYPFLKKEIELIRKAYQENKRVLGICLGSQLIAKALGGDVIKGGFGQELGNTKIFTLSDFKFLGDQIEVFQWHGDTFSLPSNAKLLAYSNKYFQAFRIGKILGLQFHVEVDSEIVKTWIETYGGDEKLVEDVKKIENKLREYSKMIVDYIERL
ncbi:type 1 glutamine amidotransferase [Acidianus manzaensis]|uniref:GMP synthase n=1 Tax=Acidianus manzaensis TaxID=282676 RepID=A0A1W6JYA8_9CREN|nr:type 1 glutamine amidotransferase [Acidianus manzaensis]ARM75222.1 GMP synthase [Acidianus manzaensis]